MLLSQCGRLCKLARCSVIFAWHQALTSDVRSLSRHSCFHSVGRRLLWGWDMRLVVPSRRENPSRILMRPVAWRREYELRGAARARSRSRASPRSIACHSPPPAPACCCVVCSDAARQRGGALGRLPPSAFAACCCVARSTVTREGGGVPGGPQGMRRAAQGRGSQEPPSHRALSRLLCAPRHLPRRQGGAR